MKTGHLSEIEIQEFVLHASACERNLISHMAECDFCRAKAGNYQLLFSEIKLQPKPVFDFDLSVMVMSEIQPAGTKSSFDIFFVYLISVIASGSVGFTVYLFRTHFENMLTSISALFIYLILAASVSAVLFRSIALYKKYRQQINGLNYY